MVFDLSLSAAPWLAGLLSLFLMLIFTPVVIRLARALGWIAQPRADRWHQRPTALLGGIAIYLAATIALIVFSGDQMPWFLWMGGTVMFLTGLVDDLKPIGLYSKVLTQITATGFLIAGGVQFGSDWPLLLAGPVTFLWVVGITNALNLLDNMDGLSAGIAGIIAAFLAGFAYFTGAADIALVAAAVSGAAFGFLVFNFKPARIFMGDCGSLFLGYTVASLALMVQGHSTAIESYAALLLPVTLLAIPIFDTTLVTLSRLLANRKISLGGRDHTSHRLVFLGMGDKNAVLVLYAACAFCGAVGLIYFIADARLFYAASIYLFVGLGIFGAFLLDLNVYGGGASAGRINGAFSMGNGSSTSVPWPRFSYRSAKTVALVTADALLITACYIFAYTLRFESGLPTDQAILLKQTLPWIVVVKMTALFFNGVYFGIWRHAGTPELMRVLAATALGSWFAFAIVTVGFTAETISLSVFIMDGLLCFIAIASTRFAFRGMTHFMLMHRETGRPALLYGATDAGILSLRGLRVSGALGIKPIGFLDDDPSRIGLSVQGLPILGTSADLELICRSHGVKEVVIAGHEIPLLHRQAFEKMCRENGIECRQLDFLVPRKRSGQYVNGEPVVVTV